MAASADLRRRRTGSNVADMRHGEIVAAAPIAIRPV